MLLISTIVNVGPNDPLLPPMDDVPPDPPPATTTDPSPDPPPTTPLDPPHVVFSMPIHLPSPAKMTTLMQLTQVEREALVWAFSPGSTLEPGLK
jgi:hypothetical protein